MNHAKKNEEECSKQLEELMQRPRGRKELEGTKNKKKRRERTQVERQAFHGKKDFSSIVNEKNQGTTKNRAL